MKWIDLDCVASEDDRYRLWLSRTIRSGDRMGLFVMLNPSQARGENQGDPTQRKCTGFAERLGWSRSGIVNLFTYLSPYQEELFLHGYENAVGPQGRLMSREALFAAKTRKWPVICAWGSTSKLRRREKEFVGIRAREVARYAEKIGLPLHALATTADGTPRHPQTLGYEHASLKPWSPT